MGHSRSIGDSKAKNLTDGEDLRGTGAAWLVELMENPDGNKYWPARICDDWDVVAVEALSIGSQLFTVRRLAGLDCKNPYLLAYGF